MKSLKHLIICLLIAGMYSCDQDIIDLESTDTLPVATGVAGLTGLEASMLQVYETARRIHENNEISLYKQCGTDIVRDGTHLLDVADGGMEAMMLYTNNLAATSNEITQIFDDLFAVITRCNVVIQFADNFVPDSDAQAARRDRAKGEAHALRAYAYLEMVRRWDNVVLVTNILEEGDEVQYDFEYSTIEETYDFIIEDCMNAVSLLPTRAGLGDTATTASKGLAYHLMSMAYMDMGEWSLAAQAADEVVNDPSYALQPLDNIFGLDGGKTGEENNQELILSWAFSPNITNRPQRTMQMYVPLYRLVNGLTTALDQGGRPWSRLSPSEYYWTLFEDGDGRLEAWHKLTWYYNDEPNLPAGKSLGDPVLYEDLVAQFGPDAGAPLRYVDPTTNKFFEDGTYGRETNDAEGFRNVIVYRLSHAYLTSAEAHWRNGNTATALLRINALRERAFGDASHNFASLDLETIIEEHARELGHEGHRWAFLKRLGLLLERVQMHNPAGGPNIQPQNVRWPIPQTTIDLTGLGQNDGY